MTRKELLKGLTEEQIEEARNCKSQDELIALARKNGVKLTDEQLAYVSGGCGVDLNKVECPQCGARNFDYTDGKSELGYRFTCRECGYVWERY